MSADNWRRQPEKIELGQDEAHVWRASLAQDPATIAQLAALLAADERRRADRYLRAVDRDHFIVARGVLRKILAAYLPISPADLVFAYNQYGRPRISAEQNGRNLNFNLSHSHELALYALTIGRGVGIDVEYMREDFATLEIAEHFFAKSEVTGLASLPADQQVQAFFNCWSRKESYIKALGLGVSYPLARFAVELAPGRAPALLKVDNDEREPERWQMYELPAGDGYAAAMIIEMPAVKLSQWQWEFNLTQSR